MCCHSGPGTCKTSMQHPKLVPRPHPGPNSPPAAIIIGRSPAADHGQQLKWSDFLADMPRSAMVTCEAQHVLGQYHHEAGGSSVLAAGSSSAGGGRACGDGGGGDDGAAAFIDAILDCDKETGVDQLIAELLADPAYYAGSSSSSSEMGWGC